MGRLDGLLERRVMRRWSRDADGASHRDPAALKAMRAKARAASAQVERMLLAAEAGLVGANDVARPLHADWAWRPELWSVPVRPAGITAVASGTAFGQEAKVFLDCPVRAVAVRQVRNSGASARAHFGVAFEIYQFDGNFLSFALDLPGEAVEGLCGRHIMRVTADVAAERAVPVYARLNLRHGPNVSQVVRRLDGEVHADLDLAEAELGDDRITAAWIDLIFEAPAMNRIVLGDLTLTRRPRAEV